MTQTIRPSQFIITYGPGAILEGENGPRLIPDLNIGLFNQKYNAFKPEDYRIDDNRMSIGLLDGANICRLPTNDEHGYSNDRVVYRTKLFPGWKLCHNEHGESSILYNTEACPICQDGNQKQLQAVRFVMGCKDGHLDDVQWGYLIHKGVVCNKNTINATRSELRHNDAFWWDNKSGDIYLKCPRCGTSASLNELYYRNSKCSGRHPQREEVGGKPYRRNCEIKARIIARQAANIRVAEIRTLLSIQSIYTNLDRIIQCNPLKSIIDYERPIDSEDKFKQILDKIATKQQIPKETVNTLRESDWGDVQRAINDSEKLIPKTYHELISDEFNGLYKASIDGAPPQNSKKIRREILFEVDPHYITTVITKKQTQFKITPIQTLRTVTVQEGFSRDIPEPNAGTESEERKPPKIIPVDFRDDSGKQWFPGVEFLGEGLFIRLDSNNNKSQSFKDDASMSWDEGLKDAKSYPKTVFRDKDSRNELCPRFVWWHTLSHLLIRAIGEEAGYSSASIRERIYSESADGTSGGILLYATQPGNEGTLGGLVALAPYMQKIFEDVLESVKTCSGDPLCSDAKFHGGRYNGSACYACLMNSETSCEHRNMWLDRHVLLNNLP